MNLIGYTLFAILASVVCYYTYCLVIVVTMMICTPFLSVKATQKAGVGLFLLLAITVNLIFWALWANYFVHMTIARVDKPDVTWDWLYWVVGFVICNGPIGLITSREQKHPESQEGQGWVYQLMVAVLFIVCANYPLLVPTLTSKLWQSISG